MISIITINYNNRDGLKNTIESVIGQSHDDFEYIVIDGNSTDGSKEVINTYSDHINYSISEPDQGVYQAMNKGIRASKGKYLLFLNSGDTLYDDAVLKKVDKELNEELDIYYGNLVFIKSTDKKVKVYPKELTFSFFYNKSLGHPASFIKRTLFDSVFYYNENLKIVSDWEFFICAICKYNATYKRLDLTISNFDTNGMSSLPVYKNIIKQETEKVLNKHFSFLIGDFEKAEELKKLSQTNRFKMLVELEKSTMAKKINSLLLRIFLKIFRNKSIKDL